MAKFLSEDWLQQARAIREEYTGKAGEPPHRMKMNLIITAVPADVADGDIDAHFDSSGDDIEMDLGHIDPSDLTVTIEYDTAKAILVEGNPQAGMQAFMAGKIQVKGDMTKLMAMQGATPDPVQLEIAGRIHAITD